MPRVPLPQAPMQPDRAAGFSAPDVVVPSAGGAAEQLQALGAGTMRLASVVQREEERLQARIDDAQVLELDAKLSDADRGVMSDFDSKLGRAAIDGKKDALAALERTRAELEAGVQNDTQREMFRQRAEVRRQHAANAIESHFRDQVRAHEIGGAKADLEASITDAIVYYRSRVGQTSSMLYLETAKRLANQLADKLGYDPEDSRRKQLLTETTTKIHSGIIGQLIDQDPERARRHLDAAVKSGAVDPLREPDLRRAVENAGVADQALRLANELEASGKPLLEQKAEIDRRFAAGRIDARVAGAAWATLRADDAERYEQQTKASNQALRDGETWAKENRGRPLTEMPPSLRDQLEKSGRLDDLQLFVTQGGQWIRTAKGLDALLTLPSRPEVLRGTTLEQLLRDYRTELDDDGLAKLANAWYDAHKVARPPVTSRDRINTLIELAMVDAKFLDPTKKQTPLDVIAEKRLKLAIEQRAENLLPTLGEKAYEEAAKIELGNVLRDQAGAIKPAASLSPAEKRFAYWDTSTGIRVFQEGVIPHGDTEVALTAADREAMLRRIDIRNEEIEARNRRLGLGPTMLREPTVEPNEQAIAEEFAQLKLEELNKRREAEHKLKERAQSARTPNYWSIENLRSPWGR